MSDETLELGQLVADHEAAHDRAEAAKVDLNDVGRVMAEFVGPSAGAPRDRDRTMPCLL